LTTAPQWTTTPSVCQKSGARSQVHARGCEKIQAGIHGDMASRPFPALRPPFSTQASRLTRARLPNPRAFLEARRCPRRSCCRTRCATRRKLPSSSITCLGYIALCTSVQVGIADPCMQHDVAWHRSWHESKPCNVKRCAVRRYTQPHPAKLARCNAAEREGQGATATVRARRGAGPGPATKRRGLGARRGDARRCGLPVEVRRAVPPAALAAELLDAAGARVDGGADAQPSGIRPAPSSLLPSALCLRCFTGAEAPFTLRGYCPRSRTYADIGHPSQRCSCRCCHPPCAPRCLWARLPLPNFPLPTRRDGEDFGGSQRRWRCCEGRPARRARRTSAAHPPSRSRRPRPLAIRALLLEAPKASGERSSSAKIPSEASRPRLFEGGFRAAHLLAVGEEEAVLICPAILRLGAAATLAVRFKQLAADLGRLARCAPPLKGEPVCVTSTDTYHAAPYRTQRAVPHH